MDVRALAHDNFITRAISSCYGSSACAIIAVPPKLVIITTYAVTDERRWDYGRALAGGALRCGQELFPDLSFVLGSCSAGNTLSISRRDLDQHSPAGLIYRARIVVTEDKKYDFQVLLRSKEAGYIDFADN